MGVSYLAYPLNRRNAEMVEQLPDGVVPSNDHRNPTPKEMRRICESLEGHTVELYRSGFAYDLQVDNAADPRNGPWAFVHFHDYIGDEDTPLQFSFDKGHPEVILAILCRAAKLCGPFIFFDDQIPETFVVTPDSNPGEILAAYNAAAG